MPRGIRICVLAVDLAIACDNFMAFPPLAGTYVFDSSWDDPRDVARLFKQRLEGAATLYREQSTDRTRTPANVGVLEQLLSIRSL